MLSATSNGRQSRCIIQLLPNGLIPAVVMAILLSGPVLAGGLALLKHRRASV